MHGKQWKIQDFLGGDNSKGGHEKLLLGQFFPQRLYENKKIDWEAGVGGEGWGRGRVPDPLDPPMEWQLLLPNCREVLENNIFKILENHSEMLAKKGQSYRLVPPSLREVLLSSLNVVIV